MEERPAILIADDNRNLCKSMSFVLERKGYAVITAQNGRQAVERCRERPFEMILLDIKMPVMDGVEAHRRIKEIRPDALVMMMTACSVEELVEEALQEGAYGVLYKPLDIEEVVTLAEKARQVRDGPRMLVVDDDPDTRITLENILVKRGARVGVACTGEEAVAMVRQMSYEIVFVGIVLPTIDGLETCLRIKEIRPETTPIIITGYGQDMADTVTKALNSGAYACLRKPLDVEELLRVVDEILHRKRSPE